ncbi:hypothetical protein [Kribbella sp. NPDC006257]|uniref:hypothetical protein n=1 Tax=Kribbella sp. NPDC006257 TaxID=3156738 RepID=UPI0033AEF0E9
MGTEDTGSSAHLLRALPEWSGRADRTDWSRTAHWAARKQAAMEVEAADAWQPPWWLLAFGPLCWLLISALVFSQRGLLVGLIAFALLAPVGMPIPAILRWIRTHRRLDGAYLGPLAFAATAIITDVPLWVCAAGGLGAAFLSLMLGAMHDFHRG